MAIDDASGSDVLFDRLRRTNATINKIPSSKHTTPPSAAMMTKSVVLVASTNIVSLTRVLLCSIDNEVVSMTIIDDDSVVATCELAVDCVVTILLES